MSVDALHQHIQALQETNGALISLTKEDPLVHLMVLSVRSQAVTLFIATQHFAKFNRNALFLVFLYDNGNQTVYNAICEKQGRNVDSDKIGEMLYFIKSTFPDLQVVFDETIKNQAEFESKILYNPESISVMQVMQILNN